MFKAFSDGDEHPGELFNQRWKIKELCIKLYSSCGFTHAGLDALFELMDEYHLTSRDIERMDLRYPESRAHMIDNNELKSHCSQYVFAVAAVNGQVVIDDILQDHSDNSEIKRLSKGMRVIGDSSLEENYSDQFESVVEIETKDGRNISKRVNWPKGSPEKPLPYNELKDKFFRVATTVMSKDQAEEILAWVETAEKQKDVETLCDLLRLQRL